MTSPVSPRGSAPEAERLTVRSPEDLVAAVPVILGFAPEESVVMLTQGAEHEFHARADLPVEVSGRRACAEMLLAPVVRQRVWGVVFVLYTADRFAARQCARSLHQSFTRRAVEVLAMVRSDGRRWFALSSDARTEGPGHAYDASGHEFTARAVASGRVMLPSRAELAASVAADPTAAEAVATACAGLGDRAPDASSWVTSTVERLVSEHARPDVETSARLLRALSRPDVRDAVLRALDRHAAERIVPLLSALTRSAPADLVAPVASALAFAAWLAGDGALAWCAIDRAEEGPRPCPLAAHVARALELAMPPGRWPGP